MASLESVTIYMDALIVVVMDEIEPKAIPISAVVHNVFL